MKDYERGQSKRMALKLTDTLIIAIQLDPKNAPAYQNLGLLNVHFRKFHQAHIAFSEAIKIGILKFKTQMLNLIGTS